jgi:transglutaminase-like putative cysteine protease
MQRDVTSRIVLTVTDDADLVFAVAVAGHYTPNHEHFTATLDGTSVPTHEFFDAHGTRLHRVKAGTGELVVEYQAMILGEGAPGAADEAALLAYLRPSRYAPSDSLAPTAAAEFDGITEPAEIVTAVRTWVNERLSYIPGSSLPTDGAERTLLAGAGVCRDYAHLTTALLRAKGVPARCVAVYAPALDPMDFHAVTEAWVDDAWRVVDATGLAPRDTLVRIATGRDAADIAFLTVVSGRVNVGEVTVTAVADEITPDDPTAVVQIH